MRTHNFNVGEYTYTIDTYGVITNLSTDRVLNGWVAQTGYRMVSLGKLPDKQKSTVHSLLAKFFIPNPLNLPEVNHIDSDKLNNSLSNLEWVSGRDNVRHAFTAGVCKHSACMDYSLVEPTLQALYLGTPLVTLASQLGIADSGTLRKLLKREAIRRDELDKFELGCSKGRQVSSAKTYRQVCCTVDGVATVYEALNVAARAVGCSGGSLHKALAHGREYRGGIWSYVETI